MNKLCTIAIILIFFATSCKKKYCYECRVTTYTNGVVTGTSNQGKCDLTKDEGELYRRSLFSTETYGSGNYKTTITTTADCEVQ